MKQGATYPRRLKTGQRMVPAIPAARSRRQTLRLTEDEADTIILLRRWNQREYTLEEAMNLLGYAVERPAQR